jgi:Ca2+-binding RTX toxin-like protein
MVDVVIAADFTTRYDIAVSNTRTIIEEGVSGHTSTQPSIREIDGMTDNVIILKGTLSSENYGLDLRGTNTRAIIEKSGLIEGSNGVALAGSNEHLETRGVISCSNAAIVGFTPCEIVNHGIISGAFGISTGSDTTITNTGTIIGKHFAISLYNEGSALLTKSSIVTGDIMAVSMVAASGQTSELINHGLIAASHSIAVGGLSGNDQVTNRGEIRGLVQLGAGNDTFDNRGGVFKFNVEGGIGDDTYVVSGDKVSIVEAASGGNDTVKSTVSLSLSSALLASDELENLVLLGHKNTKGVGNTLANELKGNAGNNILVGMGGADTLEGAKGNDILTGGPGGDTFVFKNGSGRDIITRLEIALNIIDLTGVSAISGLSDLKKNHAQKDGADLVLSWNSDEVRIRGAGNADLDDIQFLFA